MQRVCLGVKFNYMTAITFRSSKKGQVFLITAAIIIVILVLLKTGVNLPDILQGEKELKSRFEKKFFSNIVDELVKVIDISYYQSNDISNNVFDFGNFTRKKMTERLQGFEFLFVGAMTPASPGSITMNVTYINLLNMPINATLQLNSSTPVNYSEMTDSTSWTTNYTITQGQTYILTIGYNGTYSENITIRTKVNKSVYVGFFDITFVGSETTYKDKFQKNYTLPVSVITTTTVVTTSTTSSTSTSTTLPTSVPTFVNLYLNNSEANTYYVNQTAYNFTAIVNVTGLPVNLTTNMTGWADQSGITSTTNISIMSCAVNDTWYNITGYHEGNSTYLPSSTTHYAICYETTTTTSTTTTTTTPTTTTTTPEGACSGLNKHSCDWPVCDNTCCPDSGAECVRRNCEGMTQPDCEYCTGCNWS